MAEQFSRGSLEAGKELMDRIIGKPKQSIESLSVNITYVDFLNNVAKIETEEFAHIRDNAVKAVFETMESSQAPQMIEMYDVEPIDMDDMSWL